MAWLSHPALVRLCRIAIGVVFLWSGLAKVGDLQTFSQQVHNFRLLPVALENILAMTLPWIEVVAGLSLALDIRARSGAVLATALMVVFTLGVASALARGLDFECGCFGTSDASSVGITKVLTNLGLLAIAWAGTLQPKGQASA